ncbi:TIGR03086 family metal-binding protein [Embleya scabrispora]|uniref:TIGR03086 family metal-binding protein n=1 Tax=Embleya scabrispora TaxID=159449 RepID=UPI00036CE84E|nr:TIGR03086 family metal-binding protein [Embleya scabrispora]MYS87655.1 TIGR03086 family protein [Streptomyces sp. SID5474]
MIDTETPVTIDPAVDIGGIDVQASDRRATVIALDTLRLVRRDQWELPTPCEGWDLRGLLGHMVAENRGFVAAAGGATDPDVWRDDSLGEDPWVDFAASAVAVTAALSGPEVLERRLRIREFGTFPGSVAIAMHFVDNLVHAWDLARAIGLPGAVDPELAMSALAFAERWEPGESGGAFGGAVEPPVDATPGERLVALLGRTPHRRSA